MWNKFKAFKELTKDNFDYIASTATVVALLYAVSYWAYSNLSAWPPLNKISVIIVIIFLLWLLRRNLSNALSSVIQGYRIIEQDGSFTSQSKNIIKGTEKIDFEKIVPKTPALKQLYEEILKLAQKQLAQDVLCAHTYISISFNKESRKLNKFSISGKFEFCSPSKKMGISYYHSELKTPKQINRDLSYSDHCYKKANFLEDPHWREAVIEALERSEHALVGRNSFQCVIKILWWDILWIVLFILTVCLLVKLIFLDM